MIQIRFLLFLLGFWLINSTILLHAQTADLTIQITKLQEQKGKIQLGLYDNSDNFPKKNMELMKLSLTADTSTITHTISDLPFGEYSIAFYHDINDDKKCNRN